MKVTVKETVGTNVMGTQFSEKIQGSKTPGTKCVERVGNEDPKYATDGRWEKHE